MQLHDFDNHKKNVEEYLRNKNTDSDFERKLLKGNNLCSKSQKEELVDMALQYNDAVLNAFREEVIEVDSVNNFMSLGGLTKKHEDQLIRKMKLRVFHEKCDVTIVNEVHLKTMKNLVVPDYQKKERGKLDIRIHILRKLANEKEIPLYGATINTRKQEMVNFYHDFFNHKADLLTPEFIEHKLSDSIGYIDKRFLNKRYFKKETITQDIFYIINNFGSNSIEGAFIWAPWMDKKLTLNEVNTSVRRNEKITEMMRPHHKIKSNGLAKGGINAAEMTAEIMSDMTVD